MVESKLMQEVGVYSLALRTVFKFGLKLKKKKEYIWPCYDDSFTRNAMHCIGIYIGIGGISKFVRSFTDFLNY